MRNVFFILTVIFFSIIFTAFYFVGKINTHENFYAQNVVRDEIPRISTSNFEDTKISFSQKSTQMSSSASSTEDYNLSDALKYTKKQEALEQKIRSLTIKTNQNLTIENTCKFDDSETVVKCKQGLFLSCADSLYLGFEMTEECKQFDTEYYDKFLAIKNEKDDSLDSGITYAGPEYIETKFGRIEVNQTIAELKIDKGEKTINSSEINNDREILSGDKIVQERKVVEPEKPASFLQSVIVNRNVPTKFNRWVSGWATLFAINGGRDEAGYRMNKYTAFGYNPYSTKTCIVSLPYKTVDLFYGTNLDYCVKTKNVSCIIKIKQKVKNASIEIIMVKNGKRAVLPLGDFGPAEWTGNALDLTACGRNLLGATGKDLVKFRPLYR